MRPCVRAPVRDCASVRPRDNAHVRPCASAPVSAPWRPCAPAPVRPCARAPLRQCGREPNLRRSPAASTLSITMVVISTKQHISACCMEAPRSTHNCLSSSLIGLSWDMASEDCNLINRVWDLAPNLLGRAFVPQAALFAKSPGFLAPDIWSLPSSQCPILEALVHKLLATWIPDLAPDLAPNLSPHQRRSLVQ